MSTIVQQEYSSADEECDAPSITSHVQDASNCGFDPSDEVYVL